MKKVTKKRGKKKASAKELSEEEEEAENGDPGEKRAVTGVETR